MTAWEILTGNSTLQTGTAWEHLNNQAGGGTTVVQATDVITAQLATVSAGAVLSTLAVTAKAEDITATAKAVVLSATAELLTNA